MAEGGVRFIRVRGRVVPIRQKKSGDIDQRHVSPKALATAAGKKKPTAKSMATGAAVGALAGASTGIRAAKTAGKYKFMLGFNSAKGALGGVVGAAIGLAVGSATYTSKREVANRLKRKK